MIPKIIHQTWRNEKSTPASYKLCIESVNKQNPSYSYRFYDDEECREIVRRDFKEFLSAYNSMTPVEKADLFRYLIVYRDGGVYLDIDCYCVANFDRLIYDAEFVAGYEQGWKERAIFRYTQWAFAARAGHPVLIEAANRCKANHLQGPTTWTLKKTGPIMWTYLINEMEKSHDLKLGKESWFGSRILGINARGSSHLSMVQVPSHQRKSIVKKLDKSTIKKREIYIVHLFYGSWHENKNPETKAMASVRALQDLIGLDL